MCVCVCVLCNNQKGYVEVHGWNSTLILQKFLEGLKTSTDHLCKS
jgi:hypothetical protein